MLRQVLAIAAPFVMAAAPAAAAGGPAQVGQYLELQPVGLPIVVRGQLVNYIFVYVRLNLAPGADMARLRDKEPVFRDALVRLAHRAPFTDLSDYNRIDAARLSAGLMHEAAGIAGPGAVRAVQVTSQAPRRRLPLPKA